MNVYANAASGAQTVRQYQRQWVDTLLDNAELAKGAGDLNLRSQQLLIANQNLTFASDIMGLVLKNLSQLQP